MSDETKNRPTGTDTVHYEGLKLSFRGPAVPLDAGFVAVLGGSETFGKFVEKPYPALLAEYLGEPVANFGVMHGGLTLFEESEDLFRLCNGARLTVLQVTGAQTVSNRLYMVHSRRNDRFLSASKVLTDMYPDVDFTEFAFTGHLLSSLQSASPTTFDSVMAELRTAWFQRTRSIIRAIEGDVVLLWMSERTPEDRADEATAPDPLFVNRDMLERLQPDVAGIVEVVASDEARAERNGSDDERLAAALPGPLFHREVAEKLAGVIAETTKRPAEGALRSA